MSGKYQKNTKTKKKKSRLPMILGVAAVILVMLIGALLLMPGENAATNNEQVESTQSPVVQNETVAIQQTEPLKVNLGNSLGILDVGSYTGAFVEDGSDEVLSGILMLKVINNGEDTVEYAKLTMDVNGETAEFTLTTLKPGDTVVLLEKNRMAYDQNIDYGNIVCENLALFQAPLNLYEDKISIQILDGAINVTNISQEDITGRVSIYYKNKAAGIYYGGITYRVTLENGLKAGEIRQMMADHFSDTGSEIMFITIAQ